MILKDGYINVLIEQNEVFVSVFDRSLLSDKEAILANRYDGKRLLESLEKQSDGKYTLAYIVVEDNLPVEWKNLTMIKSDDPILEGAF